MEKTIETLKHENRLLKQMKNEANDRRMKLEDLELSRDFLRASVDNGLKAENRALKENLKDLEAKVKAREESWIRKMKSFEQKNALLLEEKSKLGTMLAEYERQFELFHRTKLPRNAPLLHSSENTRVQVPLFTQETRLADFTHPLPFDLYFKSLHDSYTACNHKLEKLMPKLTDMNTLLKQLRTRKDELERELVDLKGRLIASEDTNQIEMRRVTELQVQLEKSTKNYKSVLAEKEALERKILTIGEGFMKILQ
jgi:chromosome segregation ATPase